MRLRFTWRAQSDLERLRAFIAKDNPQAARRIGQALLRSIHKLVEQPQMGAVFAGPGNVRRWVAGPYVIHYFFDDQTLTILRIWHGREHRTLS